MKNSVNELSPSADVQNILFKNLNIIYTDLKCFVRIASLGRIRWCNILLASRVLVICKLETLNFVKRVRFWVFSAVNHPWWMSMLFLQRGLLWLSSAACYIWWQRWDDDNCQTGVALPMKFPGQDSVQVFL